MVGGDGVGDGLHEHGLAGAGRGDDEAALPLADGRQQVQHPAGQIVRRRLQLDALVGVDRGQVVEEDLVPHLAGMLEVDRLDLDQGEVALPFLRGTDLARDGVAGAQVELADLGGRHVDVVRPGQVVVVGRAEETEAVGQDLQHALGEDQAAFLGLRLQDLEDQLLLAHAGNAQDAEILGDAGELADGHLLQHRDIECLLVAFRLHLVFVVIDVGHGNLLICPVIDHS